MSQTSILKISLTYVVKGVIVSAVIASVFLAAIVAVVTQPFVSPISSQPPNVSTGRLQSHVKHLSVDLYPRSFDQFSNIERAARYVVDEFTAAGARVVIQEVNVQESKYKNIIGRFGPPSGPLLVIGAHYDSHGDAIEGAKYPRGYGLQTHTPGADDNASGIAGLLELARMLGDNPTQRSVELVAYTLEEPPHFRTEHMGSVWHARSLIQEHREVELMLSLEMIGYFSDDARSQRFPVAGMKFFYPEQGNFVALVGQLGGFQALRRTKSLMAGATTLPVFSVNAPSTIPGIDFSDHRSYWKQGFPALMVTDTAFYRNPNYHQAGDTFDTLDYRRMAKVVQSIYAVVQSF